MQNECCQAIFTSPIQLEFRGYYRRLEGKIFYQRNFSFYWAISELFSWALTSYFLVVVSVLGNCFQKWNVAGLSISHHYKKTGEIVTTGNDSKVTSCPQQLENDCDFHICTNGSVARLEQSFVSHFCQLPTKVWWRQAFIDNFQFSWEQDDVGNWGNVSYGCLSHYKVTRSHQILLWMCTIWLLNDCLIFLG